MVELQGQHGLLEQTDVYVADLVYLYGYVEHCLNTHLLYENVYVMLNHWTPLSYDYA